MRSTSLLVLVLTMFAARHAEAAELGCVYFKAPAGWLYARSGSGHQIALRAPKPLDVNGTSYTLNFSLAMGDREENLDLAALAPELRKTLGLPRQATTGSREGGIRSLKVEKHTVRDVRVGGVPALLGEATTLLEIGGTPVTMGGRVLAFVLEERLYTVTAPYPTATAAVASKLADAFFASLRLDVCTSLRARQEALCGAGKADACFKLGLMWGTGVGGPTSQKKARAWVDRACKGGHEEACEFLPQMRVGEQPSPTTE